MRQWSLAAAVLWLAAVPAPAVEHTKDSLETVKKQVDGGKAVLLDVREREEWDEGHVRGAVLFSLTRLQFRLDPMELAKVLPKDKVIYCHCRSGRRCLGAAEVLRKQGYDVRPLKPGYQQLIEAGFPKADK